MGAFSAFSSLAELTFKSGVEGTTQMVTDQFQNTGNNVNWEDYNYPPFVRVVHYELDDIEVPQARTAVKWAHHSYILGLSTLLLNLVAALVLAIGGVERKGVDIIYSFFNVVIFGIVGMYSFYHAYKGLATQNSRLTTRYLTIQVVMLCFMVMCTLLGKSNYNGWLNVKRAQDSSKMSEFWIVWTYIESVLWCVNIVVCLVAIHLVYQSLRSAGKDLTAPSLLAAAAPSMRI